MLPAVVYIRTMTFKGYLKKNGYLIRVWHHEGRYKMQYSNDEFTTKTVKVYGSRYAFLNAMELRFAPYELKDLLS